MKRMFVCAVAFSALAIGTAAAADLPAKMHTKAPIMDPPYNWTGAYVGLNAGYSWGNQSNTLTTAAGATVLANSNSNSLNGFIGGGQVGYNWQVNQWVLGLEADFQGSAQTGSGTFFIPTSGVILVVPSTSFSYTDNLDWFGTVRGRLGWAQQGRWLPYVTGGWAY